MLKQQTAVDIISVHTYEDDCFFVPKCSCSPAFGPARVNCDGRAALFLAATTAASADKLLYVGEYGNVTYVDVASRRYLNEVLSIQVMSEFSESFFIVEKNRFDWTGPLGFWQQRLLNYEILLHVIMARH